MENTQYTKVGRQYRFSGPFDKLQILEPGIYDIKSDERGFFFLKREKIEADELINLKGSMCEDVIDHVKNFFTEETRKRFNKYSLLYKRGMLLYGPPGTGKTSIVNQVLQLALKEQMVVFVDPSPGLVHPIIGEIRAIEKNKNKKFMIVWEEFENFLDTEDQLLDLLDGVNQVDNTFFMATTNYIDNIPPRFKNRPSRFADVLEVGLPSAELRKLYLQKKIHPEDNVDLGMWVEHTEGFTIDHLKDLIISVLVLEVPFETSIEKLKNMNYDMEYEDKRNEPNSLLKKARNRALLDRFSNVEAWSETKRSCRISTQDRENEDCIEAWSETKEDCK